MSSSSHDRLHYMDSLRAVAMFLGLVLHAAVLYKVWIYDPLRIHEQPSTFLHYLAESIHVFRMELFFLVAGFFSALLCAKRGVADYVKNRMRRILLPFVLCLIFIMPWAAAETWLDLQDLRQSVSLKTFEFFLNPSYIIRIANPVGGWLWHFWFLHVLTYFIALYVLLGALVGRSATYKRLINWFLQQIRRPFGITYLVAPTFLILLFSPPWADVPGVGTSLEVLAYYGFFFFIGVIFNKDPEVLGVFASKFRFLAIPFAVCLFVFLIPLIDRITLTSSPELLLQDWSLYQGETGKAGLVGTFPFLQNPFNFSTTRADGDWFVMCFLRAFCTWSAIAGFIFLFKSCFNQPSALGRYAADSSYFIYLIHFPLQISLGRFLRDHIDSAFLCFLVCLILSLTLCIFLYHFLCRGTWIGILLSGRKYSLNIDNELNDLRQLISNRKAKAGLVAFVLICMSVTILEYRPRTKILKISHHAKPQSVRFYIEENRDIDLSTITRNDGRNPLHMAAHSMPIARPAEDIADTINHLIQAGIPVNSLDDFGQTPLHYSIRTVNLDAMDSLIEAGADPNIADAVRGNTAMHLAASLGAEEMLVKLLKAGGDPNAVRSSGDTPISLLSRFHQKKMPIVHSGK